MKWKIAAKIAIYGALAGTLLHSTYLILLASQHGWMVTVDYNSIGEGTIELVLALAACAGTIWLIYDLITTRQGYNLAYNKDSTQ